MGERMKKLKTTTQQFINTNLKNNVRASTYPVCKMHRDASTVQPVTKPKQSKDD